MFKGKEIVVNSNNVYALEEKYLNSDGEEALRNYLKFNMGYIDGFYPFCDNLPNNKEESADMTVFNNNIDTTKSDSENEDNWGETVPFEDSGSNDFSIEEIMDMPSAGDIETEPEQEEKDIEKTNNEQPENDNSSYEVPTKVIYMTKKEKKREIPIEIKIQEYADRLYEQHGYGTDYEKSIFIAELSEKFPGLNDYEKYYDSAKRLFEVSV